MIAYYNEHDPTAASWLRKLSQHGCISAGFVDERDIETVSSQDLVHYERVHLFAGIGGWEEALRLARWPDSIPVWTGSCPCQPFSIAGKQRGADDDRHLWPYMLGLIREWLPPVVFGEQVASQLGRDWLAGVRTDLEELEYEVGAADLCAAGAGSPQIRQRLFWVARSTGFRRGPQRLEAQRRWRECPVGPNDNDVAWSRYEAVYCADGGRRRIEPGTFPLANGLPGFVGRLRGYGNAISPPIAAQFIHAFLECL